MAYEDPQPPQKPSKGYGKRPIVQWIIIYLIVAVVVYGLLYLLFIRETGDNGGISY
ncbi:MAG: hypothetical protein AAB834_00870 [Patescibacteria group bacterium]